ncbi:MAG: hypothetical protein WCK77_25065 [Verrucomicrobiota bacterium]
MSTKSDITGKKLLESAQHTRLEGKTTTGARNPTNSGSQSSPPTPLKKAQPSSKKSPKVMPPPKTPLESASIDNKGLLITMSEKWKEHVSMLLEDPEYDARAEINDCIQIDGLDKDDLLYQLAGMPYDFRDPAYYLFAEGYQIFGKVPFRPAERASDGNSCEPSIVTGPVRPITCPEQPRPGEKFAIAWREGGFWKWHIPGFNEAGGESGYDSYLDYFRNLSRIKNPDNHEFDMDQIAEASENVILVSQRFKQLRLIDHTLEEIEDLMQIVHDDCFPDARKTAMAFYAGILYTRKILYANCDELYNKKILATYGNWTSIISCALLRHGKNTEADPENRARG